MNDYNDDYELDEEEIAPPKPYTPERAAYLTDLIKEISDFAKELM